MHSQGPGGKKIGRSETKSLDSHLDQLTEVVMKCEGICATCNAPHRSPGGGTK